MGEHFTTALLLAGGIGSRMQASRTKQLMLLSDKPVLSYTLDAFVRAASVDAIVIAHRPQERQEMLTLLEGCPKPVFLTEGGATRAESARRAFLACPAGTDFVAIHDGARPLIDPDDIDRVVYEAYRTGAASAIVKIHDTVKQLDGDRLVSTLDRDALCCAQTPQVFSSELYARALAESSLHAPTDDNALVESIGVYPTAVTLRYPNPKITTPEDLSHAEYLVNKGREKEFRVGHGYDVHRLVEGRPLILGGVRIEHSCGLLGHSDADVLLHAIMDAILGALAMGDIGYHFPDHDERYRGICSLTLLEEVYRQICARGATIVHVDATLILQEPRIAPYINYMVENIANVLKISTDRVSIKATTEEGLGFTGRKEGVAAIATATLQLS